MTEILGSYSEILRHIRLSPYWLAAIVVAFPLVTLLLGEAILGAQRRGASYLGSLRLMRNVALPMLAVYVVVAVLADVPPESLGARLLLTVTVIVTLVSVLGIANGILFTGKGAAIASVPKLFLDIARAVLVAIGVAILLSNVWGYDLGELVTALGLGSIVLGLALQDTLGNLFSGITLLYERPFNEGDYIEVDGIVGKVVEVNWRAVRLVTREADLIVLPHALVAQSAVVNRSEPVRAWAQRLTLGFSYDDPPNRVKSVMDEVLAETPGVLADPEWEIKTDSYGDSSVNYEIEYYIASYGEREEVRDAFLTRVWYAARRHGLNIPFPIRTLYHAEADSAASEESRLREYLQLGARMLAPNRRDNPLQISAKGVRAGEYGAGEEVLPFGQRTGGFYLILEGSAELRARDGEGDTVTVDELGPGNFFTEIVLAGTRDNVVEVVAIEDVLLLQFSEQKIRRLANTDTVLARRIEEVNAARRTQVRSLAASVATAARSFVVSANGHRPGDN